MHGEVLDVVQPKFGVSCMALANAASSSRFSQRCLETSKPPASEISKPEAGLVSIHRRFTAKWNRRKRWQSTIALAPPERTLGASCIAASMTSKQSCRTRMRYLQVLDDSVSGAAVDLHQPRMSFSWQLWIDAFIRCTVVRRIGYAAAR